MQIKNYQQKALERLHLWFEELKNSRIEIENTKKVMEGQGGKFPRYLKNYPSIAWDSLREQKQIPPILERDKKQYPEYISRTGDNGQSIPHVCLKIPTGGGKTLFWVKKYNTAFLHRCLKARLTVRLKKMPPFTLIKAMPYTGGIG